MIEALVLDFALRVASAEVVEVLMWGMEACWAMAGPSSVEGGVRHSSDDESGEVSSE